MGEMNQLKTFTVEEANRLIPKLTEKVTEIQRLQQEILTQEVEIDALELVSAKGGEKKPSGELAEEIEVYQECVDRYDSLIDEIYKMGCFLKDAEAGLVDFYAVYQGRVVYFCWKLGEERVGFWHEVGRGYAYREPLLQEGEKESSG